MENLLIVITAAVAASFGSTAGGGGILLIPALIHLGISSQQAVATVGVATLAQASVGWYVFHKAGKIDYQLGWRMAIALGIGVIIGSQIMLSISANFHSNLLITAFLIVLVISLWKRQLGLEVRSVSLYSKKLGYVLTVIMGLYLALFHGGSGIISNLLMTSCFGMTILQAAATRKCVFILPLIITASVYATNGLIIWEKVGMVVVGLSLGAWLGSHYAIKKGDAWLRRLYLVVVVATIIKLIVS